jgi:hypothetical protein
MRNLIARLRLVGAVVFLGSLLVAAGGCGTKGSRVEGSVKYKGQPVEGANVELRTDGGDLIAVGITDPAGKFRLTTGQGKDAVPHGTYKAVVSKFEAPKATEGVKVDPSSGGMSKDVIKMMAGSMGKKDPPKNSLPERFGSPKTTTLSVTVPSAEPVVLDLGN